MENTKEIERKKIQLVFTMAIERVVQDRTALKAILATEDHLMAELDRLEVFDNLKKAE
jgi:hypothetical protein